MTKSGRPAAEGRSLAPDRNAGGPSPEMVEVLRQFEAMVDEAARMIAQLRKDKQRLEARLDESTQARAEAVQRIDALVDKIDGLL